MSDTRAGLRERVRRLIDRELTPEEQAAYLDAPMTAEEREEIRALVRWFTTRYPTPLDRLTYARQAYARWARLHSRV